MADTPTLAVLLSINPTTATVGNATFTVTVTLTFNGPNPTGTLALLVNGNVLGSPLGLTDGTSIYSFGVGLNNPAVAGDYHLQMSYSGDSSWPGPILSNEVIFTVTDTVITPPPIVPKRQAVARPIVATAAGAALTRTQIENGEYTPDTYQVSGINLLYSGSLYDQYSVATLTGTVAGAAIRQTLTLALDSNGSITGLTGFDGATLWDSAPRLTITRWKSDGTFDGY